MEVDVSEITEIVNFYFPILSVRYRYVSKKGEQAPIPTVIPAFEVLMGADSGKDMKNLTQHLRQFGFVPLLRNHPKMPSTHGMVFVIPHAQAVEEQSKLTRTVVILFFATLVSIFFFGYLQGSAIKEAIDPTANILLLAATYTIGLMGLIGIHELGHMIAAKLHNINATYPYFIPMPLTFGTFGAFIQQKSPIEDRNALFDLGIAGPIAGFVISVIATFIGLMFSYVVPAGSVEGAEPLMFRVFIFDYLMFFLFPDVGPGQDIILHPLAFAGWVGLLITGLNLIPVGQLDGGHVARALFDEEQHRIITYISAGIMIFAGFWLMALLILFFYMQAGHPGPLNDVSPVTTRRKIIAGGLVVLGVLSLPLPPEIFELIFNF